jgi:serine phosphatase RsbU (regulator of sigma subunit)
MLILPGGPSILDDIHGPAIGLGIGGGDWPVGAMQLPEHWALALYTDGLIEARTGSRKQRLGLDGLGRLVTSAMPDGRLDSDHLMKLVASATRNPDDDVAMLLIDREAMQDLAPPTSSSAARVL